MDLPRPFDEAFLSEVLYEPSVLCLDRIEEIDVERSRIVCRMPTSADLPLTNAQRVSKQHPRHVSGGLMVHVTGMLGFVHAWHLEGIRASEGWTGYGTHMSKVVFRKLATVDAPLLCACVQKRIRRGPSRRFAIYEFEFTQNGDVVYESEQSAMWMKIAD